MSQAGERPRGRVKTKVDEPDRGLSLKSYKPQGLHRPIMHGCFLSFRGTIPSVAIPHRFFSLQHLILIMVAISLGILRVLLY